MYVLHKLFFSLLKHVSNNVESKADPFYVHVLCSQNYKVTPFYPKFGKRFATVMLLKLICLVEAFTFSKFEGLEAIKLINFSLYSFSFSIEIS